MAKKKPTVDQHLAAIDTTLETLGRDTYNLPGQIATVSGTLRRIESKADRFLELQDESRQAFTGEQFNQLASAVNKIAAYAAAMDDTKKMIIAATSERIRKLEKRIVKLDARLKKLRVRQKRLTD